VADLRRGARFSLIASALAAVCLVLGAPGALGKPNAPSSFQQNPVLFVHGIEGSGAQFESQKMRFMSNGYPASWFDEVDYNSTRAVADKSEVHQQIDAAIAALKQRTGKAQVDVVAHSLGTSVMYDYLTNGSMAAQRRANVARYINVDGQSQNPGVPTLAVWAGRGTPGRNMAGAENVTIPNQTHVQTCTSAESFVEYYKFLTGRPPARDIVPQRRAIQVAGKALFFPENRGLSGATVQIWNVNDSGRRTTTAPLSSIAITDGSQGGGAWGPVTVEAGNLYEFALVRTGVPTLHIYYEPFVRSDHTLRLLASDAIQTYAGLRPGSLSAVNIRYKELWGDQGAESDQLLIDGLNICTPGLCPISKQVNAFFAFDRNRDGQTDLSSPDPVLGSLPFIQGADVFIPASSPPSGTTSFQLLSRGTGPVRTLRTPNWDSTSDGVVIQWNDFEQ
jgi:triacylglycerol esterase/lipase EstA (alpha/beta hydrolase family)